MFASMARRSVRASRTAALILAGILLAMLVVLAEPVRAGLLVLLEPAVFWIAAGLVVVTSTLGIGALVRVREGGGLREREPGDRL